MAGNPFITPKLFAFFRDLKKNNDREWFEANKDRFESDVRGPLLAFIDTFAEPLYKISPHFRADARKVGGSLFRIYRDVRFSKDKTPYKTHAGVHFRHERAKDAHAPGFYLHLDPREIFIGAGIWRPDKDALLQIRAAILDKPAAWKKAVVGAAFRRQFTLDGESYKRPPGDVDRDHPLFEDLMRKDFIAVTDSSRADVLAADFPRKFAATCKAASPLVKFLAESLSLQY
ncbi:MAG TPA: DUF2461 domain-containing protein [Candidatus Latescibacteria bacterium]|jgi:uncharacterized protein (TIGR02453 family)|nr:TIGR02453 family protein [Gemmatimonadaceae bacterium]MDP6017032.1 DUF2461 domain-containing protein [Candidatus Latescibacterota bacterium]HJP32881.1 DUF2461 domain-containing protein [Candidatus Latescibacterota bacterium]